LNGGKLYFKFDHIDLLNPNLSVSVVPRECGVVTSLRFVAMLVFDPKLIVRFSLR
jgi:hypothetical protein